MTYPGAIDSYTANVDGVDDVIAADVNELQTAIVNIETELGTDPAGTATDVKTRLAHTLSGAGYLELDDTTLLTIASGAITVTQNFHRIDTESAAASDYLDTINGATAAGMVLVLRTVDSTRNVVIRHAVDNILCTGATNITLDAISDLAICIYDGNQSKWIAGKLAAGGDITGAGVAGQVSYYSGADEVTGDTGLVYSVAAGLVVNAALTSTVDFRAAGDNSTNLLLVDASADKVQVGTTTAGTIADLSTAGAVFNETGEAGYDFRVESDNKGNIFFVDASADKIGIDTAAPSVGIVSIGGNAAAVVGMERHATTNTAGNDLTLSAGGATASATDKNGGKVVLTPGTSTGTGLSSVRVQRRTRAASTGTGDNAAIDAYIVAGEKNLTNNTDISLFEVALPAGGYVGGSIVYTVVISDNTDFQVHTGHAHYAAVRKSTTVTSEITDESTTDDADAKSSGSTLAETWTVVADTGNNKITIKCNFNSSLTPTVMKIYYTLHNGSAQAITQL